MFSRDALQNLLSNGFLPTVVDFSDSVLTAVIVDYGLLTNYFLLIEFIFYFFAKVNYHET